MNRMKALLAAACVVLLSACASNEFLQTKTHVDGLSLKNTKLYIYSFLDARTGELGPNLLNEFDRQLTQQLAKSGITSKVLRFRDSEPGKQYSFTSAGMQIPVRETIQQNLANERDMGNDYRLIIFPSLLSVQGAWRHYDVRWDLLDARTGKAVWSTQSRGKHMNAWKADEDPETRAKTIVDGIVGEMQKSNLL